MYKFQEEGKFKGTIIIIIIIDLFRFVKCKSYFNATRTSKPRLHCRRFSSPWRDRDIRSQKMCFTAITYCTGILNRADSINGSQPSQIGSRSVKQRETKCKN